MPWTRLSYDCGCGFCGKRILAGELLWAMTTMPHIRRCDVCAPAQDERPTTTTVPEFIPVFQEQDAIAWLDRIIVERRRAATSKRKSR